MDRALYGLRGGSALYGCLRKDYPVDSPVVADVALDGTDAVNPNDVLSGLATAASPRFLGIWDGVVFDYEVYDPVLLERDLERIERFYRARGYYEAKVTAARVRHVDGQHVRVQIRVHEGLPVLVAGDVTTPGLEQLPFDVAVAGEPRAHLAARRSLRRSRLRPQQSGPARSARRPRVRLRKSHGPALTVDLSREEAHLEFRVEPGRRAPYGAVRDRRVEVNPGSAGQGTAWRS